MGNEFKLATLLLVHPAPDLLVTVQEDLKVLMQRNLIEPIGNIGRKGRMDLQAVSERHMRRQGSGGRATGAKILLGGEDYEIDGHQMFQFVHKFTQETAYNRMLVSTRRQVHLAIAQYIEAKHAGDIRSHYAVLADHYLKAERLEEAKHYLLNAGDTSIECCASREALKFFTKALEIIHMKNDKARAEVAGGAGGAGGTGGGDLVAGGGELGNCNGREILFGKEEEGHIYRQIGGEHRAAGSVATRKKIRRLVRCIILLYTIS